MTLNVSIGSAQALNGREAGLQAAHQALNKLGSAAASFGFIIASHQYQAREVISGVSGLLGDTPVIGFMNLKVSVFYQFDNDEFIRGPLGPL